ncbi:BREX-1 system adenine-specific DNA-methyltransferase PglX [Enterococcus faecalis]|uniref:BREX-1 system adenine-specific DNA-methyltransferase PglX n=2 Tax=Enterococcus faecalis TaxID=1351 RepID=UPI0021C58290|nr:BREX-1 system adenine-specific DNA-methyltransferase PglX [Enterococcus faecalis]
MRHLVSSFALQEIKLIDPSMGSGHILVYAFDVLIQLYVAEGFRERDAAVSILMNNLYGLDIDKRAFQLTYFALIMKGRQYSRRILSKGIKPNVYAIPNNLEISEAELQLLHIDFPNQQKAQEDLLQLINSFKNGADLGSLIEFKDIDFENLKVGFGNGSITFFDQMISEMIHVGELLQQKYDVGITNPPYMGSSGMNKNLSNFIKKAYPDSKSDLFGVFIERLKKMIKSSGYYSMITQHAWMFLSSFEKLRHKINQQTIINMIHLGTRAFEEIGGEVVQTTAFIMSPLEHKGHVGSYLRLVDFVNHELKETKSLEAIEKRNVDYLYQTVQDNFAKIPGQPISYWVSENVIKIFENKSISEYGDARLGMATADNSRFLRLWHEVDVNNTNFSSNNHLEAKFSKKKWFPYDKGGKFRRWFGNNEYLVNWNFDGYEIQHFKDKNGKIRSHNYNLDYIFKEGITWSALSSGSFSCRYSAHSLFDNAGSKIFAKDKKDTHYILGILNSPLTNMVFQLINPTMNYQPGTVASMVMNLDFEKEITKKVKYLIFISKVDWDAYEISWDFKKHPMI